MKHFLIALFTTLFVVGISIAFANDAKTYQREGKNFTQTSTVQTSSDKQTEFTYTVKDVVYPIWITKNGRCYIIKTSKNGNQYKQYLNKEICLEICKELNVEYIENK